MTTTLDAGPDLQAQARQAYLESVTAGAPLSRQALGGMFERSPSWARDRIAEARPGGDTPPPDVAPAPPVTPVPDTGDTTVTAPPVTPPRAKAPARKPAAKTAPVRVAPAPAVIPVAPAEPTPVTGPVSLAGAHAMAWVGFALGSLVSVAGNWLHAWLPAADNPDGWSPTIASQVGAAVWPVALLVSVEVLSRTGWQPGWHWTLVRFGGTAVVALGSAVISYGHIHAVLSAWGYDAVGAGVGPLVIDGLMVVSGFALIAIGRGATQAEGVS